MLGRMRTKFGWWMLLLAGCGQILPPPPPPKMRTAAPAAAAPATPDISKPGASKAPRGPNSAPDHFKVKFVTSKGDFIVSVHREWAPHGVDRFYELIKEGYYDGNKFFRVAKNPKIVQFGLNGNPDITKKWQTASIPDDKRVQTNIRGTLAFAASMQPNSRTTQLFINIGDNSQGLDGQNFAPFAMVIDGLEQTVDKITDEYGEEPNQGAIGQVGNTYLDERYPNLDYIITARILDAETPSEEDKKAEEKPAADKTGDATLPDAQPDEKKSDGE